MIPAVIPVAGWGTRSLPASKSIPKEMLPVFDRPIVQYVVEEAADSGAKNIVLVTSKGKSAIEDHFDISSELEALLARTGKKELLKVVTEVSRKVGVQTVRQKEQRGLGHAVWMAKDLISTPVFGVLLGDDMIEGNPPGLAQLIAAVKKKDSLKGRFGAVLLMEVAESEVSKYGICEMSAKDKQLVSRCIEKPEPSATKSRLAIIGRYLLPRDTFQILENQKPGSIGEIQLTDALNQLAKQGRLLGVILKGRRFDAGDRLGFLEANLHYYLKSPLKAEVKKLLKGLSP